MADITMSLDDTLELDAIIQEWDAKSDNIIDVKTTSMGHNLEGIKTHTGIFDPTEAGEHVIDINGQKLSIKVTDPRTIPDSAVLNIKASDYDSVNNEYNSNIGPNIPDAQGDPTKSTVTIDGDNFNIVRYDRSNSPPDGSQITNTIATGDPICIIYSVRNRNILSGKPQHYIDSDNKDTYSHLLNSAPDPPHRILSDSVNIKESNSTADNNFHTFAYQNGGGGAFLERDKNILLSDTGSNTELTGLSLGIRGDLDDHNTSNTDFLEVTVLENHESSDKKEEVNRQMNKYNIS